MKEVTREGTFAIHAGSRLQATASQTPGEISSFAVTDNGEVSTRVSSTWIPGGPLTSPPMPNSWPPPHYTPPGTSWGVVTTTNDISQAEKAELVLTLLLSKLTPDSAIVFTEVDEHETDLEDAADGAQDADGYHIRINTTATFDEIIDALYRQLGNVRGRQLR